MFFALLPPTLLVCPRVNFLAPVNSSESQLFSRCLSELLGMWALSTSRERPIMKANKIRENRWAHNYERELYSCNVIGCPRCLSTALNRFVPRSQLSFSSFFHQNRTIFWVQKIYMKSMAVSSSESEKNPKITAGPVVILTSKNDQKKHQFLVTSWLLFGNFSVPPK